MSGLALVAMVFCPVPGSMPFGFCGFAFFFGDFGTELGVFFIFDRAAGFFTFGFCFFCFFAFFAGFGFSAFFDSRDSKIAGERGHAQRLR